MTPRTERTCTYVTPGEFAAQRGLRHHTVYRWIETGELEAIDLRAPGTSRPAWKISPEAVARFDQRRSSLTTREPERAPRQRKPQGITEFV